MPNKIMPTTVKENKKTEKSESKKSELLLDSLEIKGYRCFEHLTIEKLGRVNLIVGKNNVGKTALLEALWIYAEATSFRSLIKTLKNLLETRNEKEVSDNGQQFSKKGSKYTPLEVIELNDNVGLHFRHLFNNRPQKSKAQFFIDSGKVLPENSSSGRNPKDRVVVDFELHRDSPLITSPNSQKHTFHDEINNLFVKSTGLNTLLLTEIWDDVILKNEEDEAVKVLKIITSKLVDLNFINYPKGVQNRVPVVRVENIDERIPLSSLGEGMNRLLGIALALVNCKNGMLFVDEIEIGLHYSVLPDVWKLIFKTAKDLNVQVFATTHSYDCIQAFAEAAIEDEESEGNLIRLARNEDQIKAFTFDEKQLETITKEHIEVR